MVVRGASNIHPALVANYLYGYRSSGIFSTLKNNLSADFKFLKWFSSFHFFIFVHWAHIGYVALSPHYVLLKQGLHTWVV